MKIVVHTASEENAIIGACAMFHRKDGYLLKLKALKQIQVEK